MSFQTSPLKKIINCTVFVFLFNLLTVQWIVGYHRPCRVFRSRMRRLLQRGAAPHRPVTPPLLEWRPIHSQFHSGGPPDLINTNQLQLHHFYRYWAKIWCLVISNTSHGIKDHFFSLASKFFINLYFKTLIFLIFFIIKKALDLWKVNAKKKTFNR